MGSWAREACLWGQGRQSGYQVPVWPAGPSQTPWLLARALASGLGWAGRSRQSHETRLLPTWPGGLYLQDPRRQRALPGLLFMATDGSTAPNRLLA